MTEPVDPAARDASIQKIFDSCKNWGRWGDDDELGTLNLITPSKVAQVGSLIVSGKHVSCALDFPTYPNIENRIPAQHFMVVAGDACGTLGIAGLEAAGDFIGISFHGYASTHLDSFCHLFTDGLMYNGIPASEVMSTGARKNTVMAVQNGIVGRGVLLDIPRLRDVRWLDPGELITPDELDAAAAAEGITMEQGDIVLISTGRDARRADLGPWDPHEVGIAGMTPECGAWFYKNESALLGTDAVADPVPSPPQGKWPMPVHQISLVAMGMPLIDNMALLNLSQSCEEAGRWEFAFVTSPLRIGGGTGSPVNPMAIL